jgi:hypothetical protein
LFYYAIATRGAVIGARHAGLSGFASTSRIDSVFPSGLSPLGRNVDEIPERTTANPAPTTARPSAAFPVA